MKAMRQSPGAPVPVWVVAPEAIVPLVVADRGLGDVRQPPEARVVPAPEVGRRPGLIDVAEIQEAVGVGAAYQRRDSIRAALRAGGVARGPDNGARVRGLSRR